MATATKCGGSIDYASCTCLLRLRCSAAAAGTAAGGSVAVVAAVVIADGALKGGRF